MTINGAPAPLLSLSRAVNEALDKAAHFEPLFMSAPEKTEALMLFEAGEQRMHALKLKLLAAARLGEDVCEAGGHRDTADLMAQRTHADRTRWTAEQCLAEGLEQRWSATRDAWLAGALSVEHARVIVKVLDDLEELPEVYADHINPDVLTRAEAHLIQLAAEHSPARLRRLAGRLFEVVCPDAAEEIEAKKLAAMDQRAEHAMGVFIRRNAGGIEGLSEIRLRVPDGIADRFHTHLEAFTNPRVTDTLTDTDGQGEDGEAQPLVPFQHPDGQKIPYTRRLAMAFCHLLESLDPNAMPLHGGDATNIIVTIGLDQLQRELAAADLGLGDNSSRITAAQARRLACTANLIPAVLGGKSEILDLGRSQRLFNRTQRRAMALRDQQCRADGCTVPATWCEAHHFGRPWAQGGKTDLDDGLLLCRWHHHRAHDDRYLHLKTPNGDIRFSRRT